MSKRSPASDDAPALPKGYEPEHVEPHWVEVWEQSEVGQGDPTSTAQPFSMVIPPPNVTGSLHIGHALDMTIQDIMARWKRMSGSDVPVAPMTPSRV